VIGISFLVPWVRLVPYLHACEIEQRALQCAFVSKVTTRLCAIYQNES